MWKVHYDKVSKENHPPAYTLSQALVLMKGKGDLSGFKAIDLGCGNGVDTFAMLSEGLEVLAIDKESDSLLHIQKYINTEHTSKVNFKNTSFESLKELPSVNLVNTTFSLPFCHPDKFENLWTIILKSINAKGFFSGHFFGKEDSWSSNNEMIFHDEKGIKSLFEDFELLYFKETTKKGKTLSGKEKFWHVFHVVAQKR
ncbi:methyltransferase domain-containing protein [Tenacibaculum aestuariivivum]|uniref:methyltransferase domain-containing protein n=1 Tax=Tenacibaculum aestuariivivum TaxID=2006131 RepID=UPI003AB30767